MNNVILLVVFVLFVVASCAQTDITDDSSPLSLIFVVINWLWSLLCQIPFIGPFVCGLPKNGTDPMNIVVFYTDDLTFRNIGKVNPLVKTPHVDSMADKGVLFKYNCVTTSICWMSRATMMTGQFTSVHRQIFVSSDKMFDHWEETLYPQLKSAGYDVGFVGKWSVVPL